MTYIQRVGDGYRETVDEFESYKEAVAMVKEYRMADPGARFYLSSRPYRGKPPAGQLAAEEEAS